MWGLILFPHSCLQLTLKRSIRSKKIIDLLVEGVISNINAAWTIESWATTVEYIEALLACLKRELTPAACKNDLSFLISYSLAKPVSLPTAASEKDEDKL